MEKKPKTGFETANKPHPKFINNPNNRLIEGMSKTQEFNKFASELSPISS